MVCLIHRDEYDGQRCVHAATVLACSEGMMARGVCLIDTMHDLYRVSGAME